jgi:hypothetical protein
MKIATPSLLPRLFGLLLSLALLGVVQAQTPAAAPAKIAITSLVGDTMTVTTRRDTTGTNVRRNHTTVLNMPAPTFDHAVLKTAQEALARALPSATVALLRVPAPGSSGDPVTLFDDGRLIPTHGLIQGLRQQGYSHLIAVVKLRSHNVVSLAHDTVVGTGQLEGLGFYLDPTLNVEHVSKAEAAQGIIAPHVYIQLILIDLTVPELRAVQKITANGVVSSAQNAAGTDPWGALSAEQKVAAIERLIRQHVGQAVPLLFGAK